MVSSSEPSIADFRSWMTRSPIDDDRCTCGALFRAGQWRTVSAVPGHFRCYSRFRLEPVPEPILKLAQQPQ